MTDIQSRLAQKISAAQALLKTAGAESCQAEHGKDPESLINGVADVQAADNKPEGVEVPGEAGLNTNGAVADGKAAEIGSVPTNGPENTKDNPEVAEIIATTNEINKQANALISVASQILALPDAAFAGVAKTASAGITDADVERYIVKRASEGDAMMQGLINYCAMFQKTASGVPAEDVVAGAELEAVAADAQQQVAEQLIKDYPDMTEEEAIGIAGEAVAQAMQAPEVQQAAQEGAPSDNGGEVSDEEIQALSNELVGQVAEELKKAKPELSEDEALAAADEITANALAEQMAGAEGAPCEGGECAGVPKAASDDEVGEGVPAVVEDAAPVVEGADAEIDENAVAEIAEQAVQEVTAQIKQADPSIPDEEAINAAVDAVSDALETAAAQQAVGAVDEQGNPVVDDAQAGEIVEALGKTASDNPLRAHLTTAFNNALRLSPDAFAARLGITE